MMRVAFVLSLLMVTVAFVGCRIAPTPAPVTGREAAPRETVIDVPPWVNGKLPQSDTAVYAVGSFPRTRFPQDAVEKAQTQARSELAKYLEVNVSHILYDWQSSSSTSVSGQGREESLLATFTKEDLSVAMSGSQIVHTWTDPRDGTVWALAKLDKSSLAKELLKAAKAARAGLAKDEKDKLDADAEKAFDGLGKETEKLK